MSNPPDEAGERESNESSGVRGECTVSMLEKRTRPLFLLVGFKVGVFEGISRRRRRIFVSMLPMSVVGVGCKWGEVELYKEPVPDAIK